MKIRVVGATTLALIAMAVPAAAAQAAPEEFHIAGVTAPFTVRTEQQEGQVFRFENNLTVECEEATFEGSVAGVTVTTIEVVPTYRECTAFGFGGATVNANTCRYVLQRPSGKVGDASVACPGANRITISAGTCEVTISDETTASAGANQNLAGVTYANVALPAPETVTLTANLSGITYDKVKDGILCPLAGTGELGGATYAGASQAKAFEGINQKAFNVH